MNKVKLSFLSFLLFSTALLLNGCRAIAGIFKAGIWVGVIGVVLIGAFILWIMGKASKK